MYLKRNIKRGMETNHTNNLNKSKSIQNIDKYYYNYLMGD